MIKIYKFLLTRLFWKKMGKVALKHFVLYIQPYSLAEYKLTSSKIIAPPLSKVAPLEEILYPPLTIDPIPCQLVKNHFCIESCFHLSSFKSTRLQMTLFLHLLLNWYFFMYFTKNTFYILLRLFTSFPFRYIEDNKHK